MKLAISVLTGGHGWISLDQCRLQIFTCCRERRKSV